MIDTFQPGDVNLGGDTIAFPIPVRDGESLVYDPMGQTPIGGLQPNTVTVNVDYIARPAFADVLISRNDGVSWAAAGFRPGQQISLLATAIPGVPASVSGMQQARDYSSTSTSQPGMRRKSAAFMVSTGKP